MDLFVKELPWVMDRVDFLDEPDANDVPFFVSKWMGEDVCFRFKSPWVITRSFRS